MVFCPPVKNGFLPDGASVTLQASKTTDGYAGVINLGVTVG
jgi:hypothetical protein